MIIPPSLEARFLPPSDWHEESFRNSDRTLMHGFALPPHIHSAVVILAGRSEFREKYFEMINECLAKNQAVFIMDWHGQGRSSRCDGNPQKDWDTHYAHHVDDLNRFIHQVVLPALPPRTPLYMLAHSMGGNIGLRYLMDYPNIFNVAAFSAPMLGIHHVKFLPYSLSIKIASVFSASEYVFGGNDWNETTRKPAGTDVFSSDPTRDAVHTAWVRVNPAFALGDPTFGWVKNALMSCQYIFETADLSRIQIPCLFGMAGADKLVDNAAIARAAGLIPHAQILTLNGARHEILMERDEFRTPFLKAFDNLTASVNMVAA